MQGEEAMPSCPPLSVTACTSWVWNTCKGWCRRSTGAIVHLVRTSIDAHQI